MPRIIYITHDEQRFEIEAANGASVMETAVRAAVPGIEAECGGACSCATCHVHVDPAFAEIVGEAGPMEADMLDFAWEPGPTSRLSCQLKVSDELDGLVVRIPERQG
ncbi:2Fe-2S iron-sulfur cluster-binding protein [Pseudaminobacter soli (ex Li et al. 2025)]|uniref:2Fe-2S ferredoxin n=1 Tax=Pseudaminobacter soli (ex Li et al. 2025) TaxID=1295366 RepID=A0A2P7SE84_9HYPH|nr:2Fe-2S iron-sulfur cluster-binding protein [Mesorhizobium soli]PSJ60826.1 2Fe-2S ferredoxin [Mesorhizobium soli]